MVFSSHLFIFYFLPAVLAVSFLLPLRGKHVALTLFSYVFYGWANPWFILLMMFQTVVDWAVGGPRAGETGGGSSGSPLRSGRNSTRGNRSSKGREPNGKMAIWTSIQGEWKTRTMLKPMGCTALCGP